MRIFDPRFEFYAITDQRTALGRGDEEVAYQLIKGGATCLQYRAKQVSAREQWNSAIELRRLTLNAGVLFIINDRVDLALDCGADGVHLGQDDLPAAVARQICGPDIVIGLSSHDEQQAAAAATRPEADYYCTGPVWPTPTKPGRPAPGLPLVRFAAGLGDGQGGGRPWFAIGGIDLGNLGQVLDAGARRVVVVRAITEADDPAAAAAGLSARLRAA